MLPACTNLRALLTVATLALTAGPAPSAEVPPWLPRYDLDVALQVEQHQVIVRQRVTWTNRHDRPADTVVFNVHSHYKMAPGDVGFLAKMLEILRMAPSDALDFEPEPPCTVHQVELV